MVYMIMVTLLLVNMLIAMMGNTYQLVAETQKEYFRQVCISKTLLFSHFVIKLSSLFLIGSIFSLFCAQDRVVSYVWDHKHLES